MALMTTVTTLNWIPSLTRPDCQPEHSDRLTSMCRGKEAKIKSRLSIASLMTTAGRERVKRFDAERPGTILLFHSRITTAV